MDAKTNDYIEKHTWELKDYAWDYFLAHGQARLTTFRFYLVFCTILCAGIFMILANGSRVWVAGPLCWLLAFLSFVYWKVDQRHKELLKHAQVALMACEEKWGLIGDDGLPHPLCLFTRDAHIKETRKQQQHADGLKLTYSQCVRLVFLVMGVGGGVGGVILFVRWAIGSFT